VEGDNPPDAFCGAAHTCSRTFNSPGTFPTLHRHQFFGMVGSVVVVGGNTPPTVSLSSPTNGAVSRPGEFHDHGASRRPGGSVDQRRVLCRGATSLGRTRATHSASRVSAAAGAINLEPPGHDNGGLMATSAPVNITLVTPALLRVVNVAYSPLTFSPSITPPHPACVMWFTERNIFAADWVRWKPTRRRARSYTSRPLLSTGRCRRRRKVTTGVYPSVSKLSPPPAREKAFLSAKSRQDNHHRRR